MSIAGTPALLPKPLWPTVAYAPANRQIAPGLTLDQFQRRQTVPIVILSQTDKASLATLHPFEFRKFQQMGTAAAPNEGLYETLYMYDRVYQALNPTNRAQLKKLLKQGVLQNTKAEDGHSTLFHLYAMLTTRRAPGYQAKELVNETVDILNRPYAITQKFGPLSEDAVQKILMARNYPESNRAGIAPPSKLLSRSDLNVEESGTCVASSVMFYMADREPSELARHLNELTSPLNAFFDKVRFEEISPENPGEAPRILNENQISYQLTGPGEATVKVDLPPAGALRAIDSQFAPSDHRHRNAIESAYQSSLTFLANHAYDPAIDKQDAGPNEENRKGLTEPEKSLMETIVKDNGGVQSVTYQAVDNKPNPAPGEENNSYLYGYNRSFEQTTNDIIQSLKMKEPVIIGTTDTDQSGAIVTGHEITITGAFTDQADHQLKFIVADSDDKRPKLVIKSARELIPTIHHAGFPLRLAKQINQEIGNNAGVLVPDFNDAASFKLLAQRSGPMPNATAQDGNSPTSPLPGVSAATPGAIAPSTMSPATGWTTPQTNPSPNPFIAMSKPQIGSFPPPGLPYPNRAGLHGAVYGPNPFARPIQASPLLAQA